MNFDGGRVKIEVRGTLFCVFAGKFYRLYRAYILKGDDICLSSAFFQSKLYFAYLNSRLIRPNQLETRFTGKKSTGECLIFQLFKLQLSLVFFLFFFVFLFLSLDITCFPSFFPFFQSLGMFSLAGAISELHEVCDKHISELLGMIRCNKNNKIFM